MQLNLLVRSLSLFREREGERHYIFGQDVIHSIYIDSSMQTYPFVSISVDCCKSPLKPRGFPMSMTVRLRKPAECKLAHICIERERVCVCVCGVCVLKEGGGNRRHNYCSCCCSLNRVSVYAGGCISGYVSAADKRNMT